MLFKNFTKVLLNVIFLLSDLTQMQQTPQENNE